MPINEDTTAAKPGLELEYLHEVWRSSQGGPKIYGSVVISSQELYMNSREQLEDLIEEKCKQLKSTLMDLIVDEIIEY